MRNLRFAFRTLFRTPLVTTVAILSLALGIGANSAIFSLFDQILLRELPVREPEQLVNLSSPGPKSGTTSSNYAGQVAEIFSYPMARDLERGVPGFSGIAAHRAIGVNLSYRGSTSTGQGVLVSGTYFPVLGVRPALGRLFGPADDETEGAHGVAVLGHGYWETQLGADPDVLNRTIVVNGAPMTIIGVAPRGFDGTTLGVSPQVFVPLSMAGQLSRWSGRLDDRHAYWLYLFGRLAPGVSAERASAAVNAVYRPILDEVEAPLQEGVGEAWLERFRARRIVLEPGSGGQTLLREESRIPATVLLLTTGIVLLIACANIANLLLARGANRGMEMAIRLSLGASRRKVVAQLLTEAGVLAALGGAAGLLVAIWTLELIGSILPPDAGLWLDLTLQPPVVLFAAALSLGTGLLFGLFPALHLTRPDLVPALRANAGHLTGARATTRFRSALVTAQIALSMALLITAGLFLRSLINIGRVDLGMQPENVVAFGISPDLNGYEPARSRELFRRVEEELAAVPGVIGVGASLVPVLGGSIWANDVSVEGYPRGPGVDTNSRYSEVGPGFFRTLRIPLLLGREFTEADDAGASRVAIVNESFVRKFGLGPTPIGRRMAIGDTNELDIRIVGVTQDAKYSDVKAAPPPVYYLAYRQNETLGAVNFNVRTAGDPAQLLRTVPTVIARLDPNLPVEDLKTLPQQARENVYLERIMTTLSAAFAAVATLLAAIGLYGVLAFIVAQRTREIGVRMALGADTRDILSIVLSRVGRMLLLGGTLGVLAALALGRAAGSLLYGLDGHDPMAFLVASVALLLVALGSGYVPAQRAARVDPVQALRHE